MLSTVTLLLPALDLTLPIARFGVLAWIIAVSTTLPVSRHRRELTPMARAAA